MKILKHNLNGICHYCGVGKIDPTNRYIRYVNAHQLWAEFCSETEANRSVKEHVDTATCPAITDNYRQCSFINDAMEVAD